MKILLTCIALVLCVASGLRAQAPTITARTPLPNATAAGAASSIQITWSSTMNISTINHTSVLVRGSMTPTYVTAGTAFAFSTSGNAVTITPDIPFKPNEIITVQVTTGVADANGTPMAGSQTWSFRAQSQSPGQREWYHREQVATGRSFALSPGDFNNDGYVDFAVGGVVSSQVRVYTNNSNRTFSLSATLSPGNTANGVATADVNSDGILDLVVSIESSTSLSVFLGQGDGTFASGIAVACNNGQNGIIADDFTQDGIIDIVTSQRSGSVGDPGLYRGNNTGSFSFESAVTTSDIKELMQGDFDGDGDLDIVGGSGTADYYRNDGGGVFTRTAGTNIGILNQWDTGDIDGDGDLDAIIGVMGGASPTVRVANNNGAGVFTISTTPSLYPSDRSRGASLFDYDGDTDLDIFVTHQSGQSVILLNNGSGTFGSGTQVHSADINVVYLQRMADFDNDGAVDVVLTSDSGAFVYFNDPRRVLDFTATSATAPLTSVGMPAHTTASISFSNIKVPVSVSSSLPQLTFSTNNTVFTSSATFNNNSSVTTSQTIYIRYTPTAAGAFSGVVTASAGTISTTLSLAGSAYLFAFSPQELTMPTTETTTTATTSLSLSTAGLELPVQLSVTGNTFAVSTNGTVFSSSATLPAGSTSAAVYVRFAPDSLGTFNGTLSAVSGIYSTSAALSGQGFVIPSNMVTNTNDSGPGSLRFALENATAGTVIMFATGTNPTFVLSSGPITISHPVAADLSALGTVTIDGGGATAILLDCNALGMQLRGVRIINTPPGLGVRSLCPSVRGAVIQKP